MGQCPHCGATTSGDADYCGNCGSAIDGDDVTGQTAGDEQHQQGQGQYNQGQNQYNQQGQDQGQYNQQEQYNQNQGQGQYNQNQGQGQGQYNQGQGQGQYNQQGQAQSQYNQQGYDQQDGSGFTDDLGRREMLAGGGVLGLAAIGGWFFFLRGGSATGSPENVIEAYVSALNDGDMERANELIHEDAPIGSQSMGDGEAMTEVSFSVVSTEVVDRQEGVSRENVQAFATVRVETETSGEVAGQEISQTSTDEVRVAQNADGEWRIWDN